MEDKIRLLTDNMRNWGASKTGFSYVSEQLPDELRHLKSAVTVMVRLSDEIIDHIKDKPTHTYFHHYRTVNFLIDQITLRTTQLLQDWGYHALAVPASQTIKTEEDRYTALFQHKTAATRAGLGWIGKSGLLVTPEFGPRIRLGTVLTDMELPYGEPVEESRCGECMECTKKCPAMALQGINWKAGMERKLLVDAHACSTHMHDRYRHIGRGSVCGICIKSCPVGNRRIRRRQ